jgi:MFS-type transporter involved in bile tolerance (Atg22 family)
MWPGTFSMAARDLPGGGTAMFALLALAGDLGCGGGPTLVGWVSGLFGESLKAGLLCAIVFPLMMMVFLLLRRRHKA